MLERSQYGSWQSCMLLYIQGKEHGQQLLDSVINGPFEFGTIEVPATPNTPASTRERILTDLTPEEKIRQLCDIKATNIVLQILLPDVYTLVNHHKVAKEIWDRVKLLIEGTMQNVQGRQTQSYTGSFEKGKATGTGVIKNTGNVTANQSLVIRCYNCKAQEAGVIMDEEQLAFLEDTEERLDSGLDFQALINTAIFQINDIDAFYSDCDESPTASAVFMENTLRLEEESRLKMKEKQVDMIVKQKKVDITPIDYASQNKLYDHFVPQKHLSAEQVFWLPITKIVFEKLSVHPEPVQKDLSQQLPSTSMVKEYFLKTKSHLDNFDKVVKVRTKVTGQNEGAWWFEHIIGAFEKDVIPFVKSLRESFKKFKLGLYILVYEMKVIFQQMETEVEQCSIDRKYFEIEKKEILIKNDYLLEQIIYQDIVCTAMHFYYDLVKYADMEKSFIDEYNKCLEHEAELWKKKDMVEKELDVQPLSPKLRKNMEAYNTLRTTVEQARALKPLDRVKSSTNARRSQSRSNTRNNRISRPSSSNIKNKTIEVHPWNVKSSLNKMNHVSVCNANAKHDVFNANSKYVCSTCNECLFSVNHDMCVFDYLNDVNARARVKSIKSIKKKEWKPTGKVFTNVGHRWLPTGRNFTIDGTKCPLTRITSTKIVPPRNEDLGKMEPKADIGIFIGYSLAKKASEPKPQLLTSRHINLELVSNLPPPSVVSLMPPVVAPIPADITGTPSSSIIDQDAPSARTSPTTEET
ncbi:hypothetical protein Tco_0290021 [Tanacetum coccineum]